MKKGLFALIVLVLSYAILAVGNNLGGGAAAGADAATLTATAKGFGGDVTVTVKTSGDKIVDVKAEGANETQGIGSNAIDQLPGKIVEANSADVEVVSGATITSNAIIEAVKSALASNPAGGETLTGTAKGFGGDVTVQVVMSGGKIVDVKAEGANETQGIGSNAIDQLPGKIVEANSADVEVVSGATVTSNAIIEAVKSAIK